MYKTKCNTRRHLEPAIDRFPFRLKTSAPEPFHQKKVSRCCLQSNPALRTLRYTYFWFTYFFFQHNIGNTYQNFDIRTSLNVLCFIYCSTYILHFRYSISFCVLCLMYSVSEETRQRSVLLPAFVNIGPSICVPCHLFSYFHTWPNFHFIQQGLVPVDILFWVFSLGFFLGKIMNQLHPITCKSMQIPISM